MPKPPIVAKIDLGLECRCELAQKARDLIAHGCVSESPKQQPRITAAAINLQQTYKDLIGKIKGRYKGNFLREAKKAEKTTFIELFKPSGLAAEISDINTSAPVRSGGTMRPAYNRTADELREAYRNEPDIRCRNHWSEWFGCFELISGHKLLGYTQLKRYGELCLYSTVLGHRSHLDRGIMPFMHIEIMAELKLPNWQGIKWLMYGGWHDGRGPGLQLWKKKAGFDPVMFVQGVKTQ